MNARTIFLICLDTLPKISRRSDISREIADAMARVDQRLADGDIVVVAQKIVSKAEGRELRLDKIVPSDRAIALAGQTGKDPRLVELILGESSEVLRASANVMITVHRSGHIMANAGIDRSNIDADPSDESTALLWPADPDRSAAVLRDRLAELSGKRIGVIISDSFGRPWRLGTTGVAIGIAGPPAVVDRRGEADLFGRPLRVTEVGFADAVAAAAVTAMGEGAEGCPVVVVRGLEWRDSHQTARDGLRPSSEDLFR